MKRKTIHTLTIIWFCSCITLNHSAIAQTLAGGSHHSLFLCNSNNCMSTGSSTYGQLGNGNFGDSNYPIAVNVLTGITSLSAGEYHSMFTKNDGTVWVCGVNGAGE